MKKLQAHSFKLIKQQPSIKKVAKGLFIFFILAMVMLAITPWQQTATGTGRVIAYSPTERQQAISAPVEGRLGKWYVQEGSRVKKGDPIIDIVDNDRAILDNLRAERDAVKRRYLVAKHAAETAKINVDRQLALFKQGISSRKSYEQAHLEYARYQGEEANIKAELARINVRLARQHNQRVVAAMPGTILRRFAGQESVLVKAGDVIAELVPDTSSRAVELWISGNDVPLIRIGDVTRLQFEGWPAIQFSGWPSVAVGTFGGVVAVIDAADNGRGQFRILVVPGVNETWPEAQYLRQGVRAHGWVLLRRVKLWFELWRRFNGFPPSQSNAT